LLSTILKEGVDVRGICPWRLLPELFKMRIHVDMSYRYNQGNYSVIACVSADKKHKCDNKFKRGFVLEDPLRRKLKEEYSQISLHTGIIVLMLSKINVESLIVCSDVNPVGEVIKPLHKFQQINSSNVHSIEQLRDDLNKPQLKSAADTFARNIKKNYKKRRNFHRTKSYFKDGTVKIIEENSLEHKKLTKILEKIKLANELNEDNR
jgi:hypothetical protein